MMYTVCQQNNDKISDNLLPWKMRKIFILFLGKKDSSNSKKKKKTCPALRERITKCITFL